MKTGNPCLIEMYAQHTCSGSAITSNSAEYGPVRKGIASQLLLTKPLSQLNERIHCFKEPDAALSRRAHSTAGLNIACNPILDLYKAELERLGRLMNERNVLF